MSPFSQIEMSPFVLQLPSEEGDKRDVEKANDILEMSQKELSRVQVIQQASHGKLKYRKAAE